MRHPIALPALGLTLFALPNVAGAMAAYRDLDEAIEVSATIAVVRIDQIAKQPTTVGYWVYGQRATARTIEVLKGDPRDVFDILADRDFVCAPAPLRGPGVYLVMLGPEGDGWTSVNHEHGYARIFDDEIDWPYDQTQELVELRDVLAIVRDRVGEPPQASTPPAIELDDRAPDEVAAPVDDASPLGPATWIGIGAAAVLLGFAGAAARHRTIR